jgi:hypothetical protein
MRSRQALDAIAVVRLDDMKQQVAGLRSEKSAGDGRKRIGILDWGVV